MDNPVMDSHIALEQGLSAFEINVYHSNLFFNNMSYSGDTK